VILPFHNAYLTAIKGGGTSEDYDADEGAGTPKWSGEAQAHVVEEVVEVPNAGGALNEFRRTYVSVPSTVRPSPELTSGDTIVFTKDGVTHERELRRVEPLEVGIIRLYLVDAKR
jgi:hypothetical protein